MSDRGMLLLQGGRVVAADGEYDADVLIEGDCEGNLNAYDVSDPRVDPPLVWTVALEGCIETTPAVWKGRIYLATRSGKFYALGDAPATAATDPTVTTTAPQ